MTRTARPAAETSSLTTRAVASTWAALVAVVVLAVVGIACTRVVVLEAGDPPDVMLPEGPDAFQGEDALVDAASDASFADASDIDAL